MKVCFCEICHEKFYGNTRLEAKYIENKFGLIQERTSVYELCPKCIMEFKKLLDSERINNLKTVFSNEALLFKVKKQKSKNKKGVLRK